ncbi:O-antigen ligase family protein, partial [Clostridium sporogenes]|uniref:O-antigen ligase family protein n=1 Tax=Clostridium sporogenes TaxID=1509 RepID=UPI00313AB883
FSQITRYGSELGNVNAIGIIIGISSTFCFYIILSQKKYWYALFLIIMVPTILLTGSRKSLLFMNMNLILIVYFRNRKSLKNMTKFIIISLFMLLIVYYLIFNVPLFYKVVGNRVENLFSFMFESGTKEGSINERSYMIRVGVEMFKNKPFIGYGIDNYRVLFSRVPGGRETYAHNNYIELIVDTGIFGVFIYYLTHILVIRDLFKGVKEVLDNPLCYTFIAIIISYTILSTSLIYYDSKHFSILLTIASIVPRLIQLNKCNYFKKISNNT